MRIIIYVLGSYIMLHMLQLSIINRAVNLLALNSKSNSHFPKTTLGLMEEPIQLSDSGLLVLNPRVMDPHVISRTLPDQGLTVVRSIPPASPPVALMLIF